MKRHTLRDTIECRMAPKPQRTVNKIHIMFFIFSHEGDRQKKFLWGELWVSQSAFNSPHKRLVPNITAQLSLRPSKMDFGGKGGSYADDDESVGIDSGASHGGSARADSRVGDLGAAHDRSGPMEEAGSGTGHESRYGW